VFFHANSFLCFDQPVPHPAALKKETFMETRTPPPVPRAAPRVTALARGLAGFYVVLPVKTHKNALFNPGL
jgi:hypothetical protein